MPSCCIVKSCSLHHVCYAESLPHSRIIQVPQLVPISPTPYVREVVQLGIELYIKDMSLMLFGTKLFGARCISYCFKETVPIENQLYRYIEKDVAFDLRLVDKVMKSDCMRKIWGASSEFGAKVFVKSTDSINE